jgi:hypothetical protein
VNWPLILALVALVLALVHEFRAEGKSDLGWAVVIGLAAFLLSLGVFKA